MSLGRESLANHDHTSIKIIKNKIGCRDDTVPKAVGTRRHCEEDGEHVTIFRNPQKSRCREGVAEDCYMLSILLAVPSCTYSFWRGVIPTSYFIFNDLFYFFFNAGLAFVERGEMVPVPVHPRTYAHAYYEYARSICDRDRARRTGTVAGI